LRFRERQDISPVLTQKLQEVRGMREAEAALEGKMLALTDWVFVNTEGNHIDESNIRRVLHRIQKAAGLRRIRLHDTRHTYASIQIGRGVSLVYIKEQMGHSSIKVTVDTYGHLVPGANKGAADRLDSILAQPNASQAQPKSG
jgi:integrase